MILTNRTVGADIWFLPTISVKKTKKFFHLKACFLKWELDWINWSDDTGR